MLLPMPKRSRPNTARTPSRRLRSLALRLTLLALLLAVGFAAFSVAAPNDIKADGHAPLWDTDVAVGTYWVQGSAYRGYLRHKKTLDANVGSINSSAHFSHHGTSFQVRTLFTESDGALRFLAQPWMGYGHRQDLFFVIGEGGNTRVFDVNSGRFSRTDSITLVYGSQGIRWRSGQSFRVRIYEKSDAPFIIDQYVSSRPAAGNTYKLGETLEFTVHFSENVEVTGTPRLGIRPVHNGNAAWRDASYARGSGTNKLVFAYPVNVLEYANEGTGIFDSAIRLQGGTIRKAGNNTNAVLSYDTPAPGNGHNIDGGVRPIATAITSDAGPDGTYHLDEIIEATVTFNHPVDVTGRPRLGLRFATGTEGVWKDVLYDRGSGTDRLVFRYTVAAGDTALDGVGVFYNALKHNGGTVKVSGAQVDASLTNQFVASSADHRVYATARVAGVEITSDAGDDRTYHLDEVVQATVTFSHRLDVTGSPRLGLRFVSGDRSVWKEAAYDSGDGSNELVFEYRVSPGDAAGDGVGVYYDGLLKNGVTLRVAGTQVDAETTVPFLAESADHLVDGFVRITGTAITSDPGPDLTYHLGDTVAVALTFSHNVDVTGTPRLGLRFVSGDRSVWRDAAYASGHGGKTLTFEYTVAGGDSATDGLGVFWNGVRPLRGAIKWSGNNVDATLDNTLLRPDPDHRVNGVIPPVTLLLSADTISEKDGVTVITGIVSPPSDTDFIVSVSAIPVSPADAGDFTLSGSALSFDAGSNTSTGTVTLTANDNDVDEADKQVTISGTVSGSAQVASPPDRTVNIIDDEQVLTVALSLTPDTIPEDGGESVVTASLDGRSVADTTVTVSLDPAQPEHYGLDAGTLTIPAGETVSTGTLTIRSIDDPLDNADRAVTVTAAAANDQGVEQPAAQTLTITDDDMPPGAPPARVWRVGNGSVTLIWTRPGETGTTPLTGYQHRYKAGAADYGAWQDITTDAPGADAADLTTVEVTGLTNETAHVFQVRAVNSTGGGDPSASLTATPTAAAAPSAPQNLTAAARDSGVTLRWEAPLYHGSSPITLYAYKQRTEDGRYPDGYTVVGLATSIDITQLANGTLYFFEVIAVNDAAGEGATAEASARPAIPSTISITLVETTRQRREGRDVEFTVARGGNEATTNDVVVNLGVTETGDVIKGEPPATVAIPAGDRSVRLTLPTDNDQSDEDDSVITVRLLGGDGYLLGTPDSAEVTVPDDDAPMLTIRYATDVSEVGESAGSITVTLEARTGTPDRPVIKPHTVTLSTWFTGDILNPRPGEAMPGLDYDPLSENVRFLPADFTPEGRYRVAYRTFEIDIYDDEIYEEDQSFQLLLQPAPGLAVNVVLESDPRPLVTIVDDDPPPSVTVSDGGAVAEGEDAEFTIRLSAESERAVTVWYSTTGEGTAGIADYEAAGGTIRFEPRVPRLARDGGSVPGETEKTFTVTTIDDAIAEANEFLTVEVAIPPEGAGAAVLGSPVRGEARILDDDQPLSAPRGLTAFADNGAVTLQWQPPADDGGYGIAHYERRLRREDRSDWTSWFTVPGGSGADSVKIAGLTNGTAVEFELRAVNTAPVAVRGPAASVSATPAGTPPALLSATVNGSRLTLVYGSLLKTDATASNAAFTLHTTTGARQRSVRRRIPPAVGKAPTVTGISVSGASVNIDLLRPVSAAAAVTLDYSSPGSSGIRTVQGVAAADFTGQQVDNATTPTVVTTAISSTPDAKYGYYVEGDTIAVKLTFDAAVDVAHAPVTDVAPSVDINLGGTIQQAVYASGSGSAELAFEYSVVYSDYDADGVSVPAGSVALNGGAIRRDGTGTAAALTHAAVADHADHTVIGRPFISGRAFVSQPHTGGVYHRNELIEAGLTFNETVEVSGRPRVRILIANSGAYGDLVKAYYLRGSGSDTLVFGYRVRGSDRDNNGVHIYENTLAEGSITRAGTGTRVNWRFSRHAGGWGQRVDGSQDGVPLAPVLTGASGATSAALSWTAPDDSGSAILSYSYRYAEVGGDWTDWATAAGALESRTFEVEGLALDTAYTFQVRAHNAVGAGEPSNEATVTTSKAVAALSATVDGDRLLVTYDRPLKSQAVPSANLFSTLTEGDSGPAGTISAVSISGATVVLVLSAPVSPDDTITVTYTLPDPLTATNAIAAVNGTPAGALHAFPVVNVTAPTVQEIAFRTAPQAGDTYAAGEVIGVTVTFNSNVTVDTGAGNPRLSVEIGRAARQLSYTSGGGGAVLTFEYTVSEHDVDRDGIRVLGNSLSTGGGSIRKSGTRINARLGHAAGTAQAGQKVMGPPAVSAVSLTSNPAADETYRRREVIEATVTFTSAVDVDTAGGKPFVAVVVGVDRRSLEYASGSGSDTLVFTYTVTDDDLDTDGIALPENPVATGGGAIRRAGSSDVNAFLDQPGQPGQPDHKVGGYAIIRPARVSDLVATPGKHRVSLDWSAPDNGGSEITGYRIELSTDGAAWTDLQANTEKTGTSYGEAYLGSTAVRHYRVSAINARGAGPPSEPAVVAPLAATAPDPPTKLAATAVSDTRVDLIWAAPEDDGGARLSGYKVEVFYPDDASPSGFSCSTAPATPERPMNTPAWSPAPASGTACRPSIPSAQGCPRTSPAPSPLQRRPNRPGWPPGPTEKTSSSSPGTRPRATSPGPSPATRSKPHPPGPEAGPSSRPTPAIATRRTGIPAWPRALAITTAFPPSTRRATVALP